MTETATTPPVGLCDGDQFWLDLIHQAADAERIYRGDDHSPLAIVSRVESALMLLGCEDDEGFDLSDYGLS